MRYLLFSALVLLYVACDSTSQTESRDDIRPLVMSTWANVAANDTAFAYLSEGALAVDAIEAGIRITESDTTDQSVGVGGLPDRTGTVTLDACIMDHRGNAGSVTYLQQIAHPISVARLVMDSTPHVMLSGQGAYDYALSQGFEPTNLLTATASSAWRKWKTQQTKADNHDTIGMIAIDADGNISGGCSTSGMAYKLPGRVGDSPIIGAGLYVDNAVGAATATGVGEEVMKTVGSFLIVELMRQGLTPQQACEEAVLRIVNNRANADFQIGYIAIDKMGRTGAFAMKPGFEYATTVNGQTAVSKSLAHYDN
ncbi:MAG: N(4)-(beta-N-acetylglucosaminyl)-L-asparaginase [Bacteroidota bacterium]